MGDLGVLLEVALGVQLGVEGNGGASLGELVGRVEGDVFFLGLHVVQVLQIRLFQEGVAMQGIELGLVPVEVLRVLL